MYKTYSDFELRRVLAVNPKDAEALVEAADRWFKETVPEEFEVWCQCEDCNNGWYEKVHLEDYLS